MQSSGVRVDAQVRSRQGSVAIVCLAQRMGASTRLHEQADRETHGHKARSTLQATHPFGNRALGIERKSGRKGGPQVRAHRFCAAVGGYRATTAAMLRGRSKAVAQRATGSAAQEKKRSEASASACVPARGRLFFCAEQHLLRSPARFRMLVVRNLSSTDRKRRASRRNLLMLFSVAPWMVLG
jgi:hypothetical protein